MRYSFEMLYAPLGSTPVGRCFEVALVLRAPSDDVVADFLAAQESISLSYANVGGSQGMILTGFNLHHNPVQIGRGERDFALAEEALRVAHVSFVLDENFARLCAVLRGHSDCHAGSRAGYLVAQRAPDRVFGS